MANPARMQKLKGKYLWFALLGLGFKPESTVAGKIKHMNLGPNMFDKPNKDAFYIVINFLLEKLNPTRFNEAYRHCWPVLDHKADAEFRKVTCAWLKEIMDETANAGSKVLASLFLSPGGPKFISLMFDLAHHVMLQEMKTFKTDGSWVPEAAAIPASSPDMAMKRHDLVKTRFLNAAVNQDHSLRDYQKRAQLLVKSVRERRAEGAKYDEPLKRHSSDSTQEGEAETKKVRSLWSVIDGMLSVTKEERHAVDCVLKGDVDQYVLDGTNRSLNIPRCLLERIEQLPHQLSSGTVYKAGQLNLLCALELMNHVLQLLREERCRVSHAPTLQLNPQHLQEQSQQMARVLQDLHFLRQKITKDGIPEVMSNIRQLEALWDRKWMDTLTDTPLVSFLNEDPALGFLSPMAPLSFEPTADTNYRSIFSQYPATLPEIPAESKSKEGICPTYSNLKSSCQTPADRTGSPVVATETPSQVNTSLDWLFDTPPSAPPPQASVKKTASVHPKVSPMRNKTKILDMECDNLADQFADAVTTTTPTEGGVKGLDLESLLSTLHGDPFSTRKQLPRTPESLIKDVKSSWRKAVEEDEAKKIGQSTTFKGGDGTGLLSPLCEPHNVWLSPDAPSKSIPSSVTPAVTSRSSPLIDQQGDLLDHETLPEMSSCDSLSLDDEAVDVESYEDELLIPALMTEAKQTPLTTRQHLSQIQQAFNDDCFFMESRKRTPECLLSDHTVSDLDRDWLMEPEKLVEADRVFSLDLDTLETPSTPKECSLPKLITFSPIDDDIKC